LPLIKLPEQQKIRKQPPALTETWKRSESPGHKIYRLSALDVAARPHARDAELFKPIQSLAQPAGHLFPIAAENIRARLLTERQARFRISPHLPLTSHAQVSGKGDEE